MAWTFDTRSARYRNGDTGRFLSAASQAELRNDFVARQREAANALGSRLAGGELSAVEWETRMREHVRLVWTTEYALGRGGRNVMTDGDRATVGQLVQDQWRFLRRFTQDVQAGDMSEAAVQARSQLYFNAAVQAHERGQSAAWGDPPLPNYPGDGSTECRSNCRCRLSIEQDADEWRVTWHLGTAEHCDGCEERAGQWAPLILPKPVEVAA